MKANADAIENLTPAQIGAASLTKQNQFDDQQILQGTKYINYSVSNPNEGLTELGRFTMTSAHDQVKLKGTLHAQTGSSFHSIDFEVLIRTGSNATVEGVRVYREQMTAGVNVNPEISVYTRSVSGGTEFVLCATTRGNQFAAYELTIASRRAGGYAFTQSDMQSEFNTSGYTDSTSYNPRKRIMHGVDFLDEVTILGDDAWHGGNNPLESTKSGSNWTGRGWQKLASGLIIQAGSFFETHEGNWHTGINVTFP